MFSRKGKHVDPQPETEETTEPETVEDLLVRLNNNVEVLTERLRRTRVLSAILACAVIAIAWNLRLTSDERNSRITTVDGKFTQIYCLLIGGSDDSVSPIVKQIRHQYRCPAFDPNVAKLYRPTGSPVPGPTSTKTVTTPGPTRTRTVTEPGSQGPTVTVPDGVRGVPGPVRTVTRNRTVFVPMPRTTVVCVIKNVCVTEPAHNPRLP